MSETEKVIGEKDLLSLLRMAGETKKKTSSIAGEYGERVKYAAENKHLHKGALALMAKMDQMDELKRNDYWRNVLLYQDICARKKWGEPADMLDRSGADEAGEAERKAEAEAALVENNVRTLRRGVKKLEPETPAGLPGAPAEGAASIN